MEKELIDFLAQKTQLKPRSIETVYKFHFEEEFTVPFMARYRKEATGNLDETQIRSILENVKVYQEREKRRAFVLETLEGMGALTPELKSQIQAATTHSEIEDLYGPYKAKKKTKAMLAREAGAEELANNIFSGKITLEEAQSSFTPTETIKTFEEARSFAMDLVCEKITLIPGLRSELKELFKNEGQILTSQKKDADKVKSYLKYQDYFNFTCPLKDLFLEKNGHRFLAINRGKTKKVLKVNLVIDQDKALSLMSSKISANFDSHPCKEFLNEAQRRVFKTSIHTSLELELFSELRTLADAGAIEIFKKNLRNLLLAPYLGPKAVLGIDPGIRTGCKCVIIDENGNFQENRVIYLHEKEAKLEEAQKTLSDLIAKYDVKHICIGDGTYGRETLKFVETTIDPVKEGKVKALSISEAGASVYSASEVAAAEFPEQDVTVRGAISIARRFQDPLSELVKIDPRSVGVGQYQHDVNQGRLKQSLGHVVEDCVNYVGVDLNTASPHVLTYISGIGPALAQNIVDFRAGNGPFKTRAQLHEVTRFSQKAFQQSAGFLRIYQGEHPLDKTFIHPENYQDIEEWCQAKGHSLQELFEKDEVQKSFETDKDLSEKLGPHTLKDIIQSLKAPSQDPRTQFKAVEFDPALKSLADVVVDKWYTGIVNNITQFGAFVNIGIKESGLVHISQMTDQFVDNPLKVFKVGQEVKVKVIEVDKERGRLSLSCRTKEKPAKGAFKKERKQPSNRPQNKKTRQPRKEKPINPKGAFAVLKDFKVKT